MGYGWLSHTADTGIEVWADSLPSLFAEAARALMQTVVDLSKVEARDRARVVCTAAELDLLLVEFLEELLYEFEVRGRVVGETKAAVTRAGDGWRVEATLGQEPYDAARHGLRVPIKGVTYHGLELLETEDGWRCRVVLDI